ncbi:MAG: permease [Bacteroidetes bacterium HGW-Bacteroidetes-12]|nr:MAG: permease [Bacteroidetes bacterium HGW-Bacteroidetes-12]
MEIIGYIAAILVGITLGLIGSGGFLALPILVYLFHIEDVETATGYSLFLIGVVSLMGVFLKHRQGLVNYKMAFFFGIPTVLAIFITRKYIMPIIPETLFSVGFFIITKRMVIMFLLAITMLLSAIVMIRKKLSTDELKIHKKNYLLNFFAGMMTGAISGFVGIGGGFIIVPALLKIGDLSMKMAIGTTLLIVTLNSAFGFYGSTFHIEIDWKLLFFFSLFSLAGMLIGNIISKKIDGDKLKKGFGWFVLIAGVLILIKEIILV